ncbi:MAG TPA: inositol monophosphatase [Chitinispirillaceae bacterium]|jgi:histidinol phosphatase-like enzyme (inositol monophosphatase family)|nr:inositol monophosphatase [Chitinispirillaceae bacterium]
MVFDTELSVALNIAKKAGELHLDLQPNLNVEHKDDSSPVTVTDKKCEYLIRKQLLETFPDDGFLGEETGNCKGNNDRKWIVDPLDGTRPYIRNIPTHSVLIALELKNEPVIGIIHLPALKITCWAQKGHGAYLNGKQIRVSETSRLQTAMGSGLGFLEKSESDEGKKLFSIMKTWDYAYGFMDAYSYVCVASGKLDVCINLLDKPWDCAAAACIVNEAGGEFSDIYGNRSIYNGSIVISNKRLHSTVLDYFK